jgi:hypothetical protein
LGQSNSFLAYSNGLARFAFWCSLPNPSCAAADVLSTEQRIVYDGGNVSALISSIAWLSSRGAIDIGAAPAALQTAALTRKLSLDDRGLVKLAMTLLPTTESARAATITAAKPASLLQQYGRAAQVYLEIKMASGWTVFDLDK